MKLLILVTLVAFSAICDHLFYAPWWNIYNFFNPFVDIILVTFFKFVYWVAA